MKILFFGDIVGKIGRQAIKKILPELKAEFQPDLVMANAENLAHGSGLNENSLTEMTQAGINFFTTGNHCFDKPEGEAILADKNSIVIRPANYPPTVPGLGFKIIEAATYKVLVVNLMARVFIKENFDCPFRKIDEILAGIDPKKLSAIIVDFHGEATSEKAAFGWYVDGRVSAVLGTHTHIPTADAKILPGGTAFVTDAGMVGATDSIIGDKKEPIIKSFLNQTAFKLDIPEEGEVEVNAVLVEINPKTRQAIGIKRLDRKVVV